MFGVQIEIVPDWGQQLTSYLIQELTHQHNIKHRKYNSYHLQANGKAKVTNKEMENVFTKIF